MSRVEKDLTEITQSLSTATSDDNILDILKQMNALPPALSFTLELLKSTRCGKVVGAIKKSTKNDTIKALAKEVIAKMKKAAAAQGYTQTKKATTSPSSPQSMKCASSTKSLTPTSNTIGKSLKTPVNRGKMIPKKILPKNFKKILLQ